MGKPDDALANFKKALSIRREIDDKQGIGYSLKNIGTIYKDSGNILGAEKALRESLTYFEQLDDKLGLAITYNLLGEIIGKSNAAEAENYFNRSLVISKESGYPINIGAAAKPSADLSRKRLVETGACNERCLYSNARQHQ